MVTTLSNGVGVVLLLATAKVRPTVAVVDVGIEDVITLTFFVHHRECTSDHQNGQPMRN